MDKIVKKINDFHIFISATFLAIFLVSVITQVITRLLGISMIWTQDVAMYSFIWSVFMGATAMVYPESHFAFTSLVDKTKNENVKTIIHLVIVVLMLVFLALMLYYGIIITKRFWNYKWVNVPQLKRGWTWICIPISAGFGCLYSIDLVIKDIQKLLNWRNN